MIWFYVAMGWLSVLVLMVGLGYLKAQRRTPEQEQAELDEQQASLRAQAVRRERDQLACAQWRASQRRREREACVSDLRRGEATMQPRPLRFDVGDPDLSRLLTESSTAAFLGTTSAAAAQGGNDVIAYYAAKMSWKWATWALESASALALRVTK